MITLDTGALIAIERRKDRMMRALRAAEQTSTPIFVPAVVLAEWWRGRAPARMKAFLEIVTVEAVTDELARAAGEAIAATPGATTIDALVMASASLRGGVVYTSDVGDLDRLAAHFPAVRILGA